jgi:pimeloyl-ACP methyl ester carboxylesterase
MAENSSDSLFSSDYHRWLKEEIARQNELLSTKQTTETSLGTMEYSLIGKGPVILAIHGTPGGYDQSLLLFDWITTEGFSLLSVSRPGYLGTPLDTGKTPAEQADALAALLDALKIEKVHLMFGSAGGASGYEFAIRHPDRVKCLVAMDAVSSQYLLSVNIGKVMEKLIMSRTGVELMEQMSLHFPEKSLQDVIKHSSLCRPEQIKEQVKVAIKDPNQVKMFFRMVRSMTDYKHRKPGLENDLEQMAQIDDLPVDKITCPSLIVHGTHDSDVLFYNGVYAYENIPGAESYWVREASHLICGWISPHADELREKVVSFLLEHK